MKWIKFKFVILILAVILFDTGCATRSGFKQGNIYESMPFELVYPERCRHGFFAKGDLPFLIFISCDGNFGSNMGVIYSREMSTQTVSNWSLTSRFWQDQKWARDVSSFAWSEDRRSIYVTTWGDKGNGQLYLLDLFSRTAELLYPVVTAKLSIGDRKGVGLLVRGFDPRTDEFIVDEVILETGESKEVYRAPLRQIQKIN